MKYPRELSVGAVPFAVRYVLDEEHCAIHGAGGEDPELDIVFRLQEDGVIVCRGPASRIACAAVRPVYRTVDGGELTVPTGRVFVRMREGESIAQRRTEIEAAGFKLEDVPKYAPHAGWIRPKSESIGEAVRGLDRVRVISGVEAVEPQMLSIRGWRQRRSTEE